MEADEFRDNIISLMNDYYNHDRIEKKIKRKQRIINELNGSKCCINELNNQIKNLIIKKQNLPKRENTLNKTQEIIYDYLPEYKDWEVSIQDRYVLYLYNPKINIWGDTPLEWIISSKLGFDLRDIIRGFEVAPDNLNIYF